MNRKKAKRQGNFNQQLTFWGLFLASVMFLVLPFIVGRIGWLSLVSLVPFFLFLDFCQTRFRKRQQLLFIFLIGIAFMAGLLFWSVQTMPDRWAYIHGWAATAGLWLNYAIFAGLFSLQFLAFGLFYVKQPQLLYRKRGLVLLPVAWVVCEFLRSLIFSFFAYGKNGSIGANWNFGSLGLAVSTTYVGYAARLVGMYGLSFIAVLMSLSLVWLVRRRVRQPILIAVGLILLLSFAGYALYRPTQITKRLAFVQTPPNFGDPEIRSHLLDKALAQDDNHNISVLVLPEYGNIFEQHDKGGIRSAAQHLLDPSSGYIVTSALISTDYLASNQLQVYDSRLDLVAAHNKYFLIPVGEYMPYVHQGILKLMGQQTTINLNQQHRGMQRGKQPIPVIHLPGVSLGSQICSGAIAPSLYQIQTRQGAEVLTNSASLSMFSHAPSYQTESYQFSRFMAIANARPFVQSAEGGHGYILDSAGQMKSGDSNFDYYFGVADIHLVQSRTLYSLVGEWVMLASIIGLAGYLVLPWIKHKKL